MTLLRPHIALLALLAVTLSSVIPQGWMPGGADGRMLLVLCTPDGLVETWVDLDDSPAEHEDGDQRMPCPFATTSAHALVPPLSAPVFSPPPLSARWERAEFTHRAAGFHARYDARAPPIFS